MHFNIYEISSDRWKIRLKDNSLTVSWRDEFDKDIIWIVTLSEHIEEDVTVHVSARNLSVMTRQYSKIRRHFHQKNPISDATEMDSDGKRLQRRPEDDEKVQKKTRVTFPREE